MYGLGRSRQEEYSSIGSTLVVRAATLEDSAQQAALEADGLRSPKAHLECNRVQASRELVRAGNAYPIGQAVGARRFAHRCTVEGALQLLDSRDKGQALAGASPSAWNQGPCKGGSPLWRRRRPPGH